MSNVEHHRYAVPDPGSPDFEQVFLPHLEAAFNFARWLLRNDHDAEDAVQEACLRAHKAFARFRGGDGKAWLMTIVRNVCYTMLKKSKGAGSPEAFDEEVHQPFSSSDLDGELGRRATAEAIQVALEKLPQEFREVIVLHDLQGMAYKEIAGIVSIPLGTVMSRLSRARARLREEILAEQNKEKAS